MASERLHGMCSKPVAALPALYDILRDGHARSGHLRYLPYLLEQSDRSVANRRGRSFELITLIRAGNVILLTLVAASDTSLENHNTVASLGSYLIIGFLAGQLGHWIGLRRKWWLMLSNLLQTMLLAVVCIIHASGALPWTDVNRQWALLIPVAAAAGLQVAISRNCGNGEVPTAMLSSPM